MIDAYTKIILTVIAAALVVLIFQQYTPRATAAFGDCGLDKFRPCYINVLQ
jgi:hypothetical protein